MPSFVRSCKVFAFLGSLLGLMSVSVSAEPPTKINFQRQIRPILSNCSKCHGPDDVGREADLRLDDPESATLLRGDYRVIDPGHPERSLLIERVTTDDESIKMPPPETGTPLKPEEIELLKAWIAQGANYEAHWAFVPPKQTTPPTIEPATSVEQPIDAYVADALRKHGLQPSPIADRPTLARRLSLDLVGLLPDPDELERFLQDARPDAVSRYIDRLLANPHYGERWGRHWLDQARYADTNGYTIDSERSMWPYRDWVLNAFNSDYPFDQFTIDQLAGDLLPKPTVEQLVATGFHRNTLVNQEGGVDTEQFRNESVVDRVNTTGAVWLGLTIGCAQCHTHKYDPISQREFYQIFAFFNQSEDANSVTPTMSLASPQQQARLSKFDRDLKDLRAALKDYDASKKSLAGGSEIQWQPTQFRRVGSQSGAVFENLEDGSVLVSGPNAQEESYELIAHTPLTQVTAIKLEALTHPSLPQQGPGRAGNGNFVLSEFGVSFPENRFFTIEQATADHSQKGYEITQAVDGKLDTGWAINTGKPDFNVNRTAVFVLKDAIKPEAEKTKEGLTLRFRLQFSHGSSAYTLGRFRISVSDASKPSFLSDDPKRQQIVSEIELLEKERKRFNDNIPSTLVMRQAKKPRDNFIHVRGDFLRRGDEVKPGTPAVLIPLRRDADTAKESAADATRLDLAQWLVDPAHPLTSRVTVNRMWQRLFGKGLVETENDFGLQGTAPTHPELLDRLAIDFVQQGWSQKHWLREVVSSHTYQQSSKMRRDLSDKDPLNHLLGRQSRLRFDAEIVRDATLSISGLFDRRVKGPSVYPPQPDGVYAFTQRAAAWPTSKGGARYRRAMYTFFMRSAPYPLLTTFDAPRFTMVCTRRGSSNTPLQALTVANDPAILEMARGLAQRVLRAQDAEDLTSQAAVKLAFQWCVTREPTAQELQRLQVYVEQELNSYRSDPKSAAELVGVEQGDTRDLPRRAAWVALARVLLNLDEMITRE